MIKQVSITQPKSSVTVTQQEGLTVKLLAVEVVCPSDQTNEYGDVPPTPVADTEASLPPLHVTSFNTVAFTDKGAEG